MTTEYLKPLAERIFTANKRRDYILARNLEQSAPSRDDRAMLRTLVHDLAQKSRDANRSALNYGS